MLSKRKKYVYYLYGSIVFFAVAIILLFFSDPTSSFAISNIHITFLFIFLIVIFTCIFLFATYLFANIRRGIFVSIFVGTGLTLRALNFREIYHPLLLLFILVLTEIYVTKIGFSRSKKIKKT
jgi:hypothetical protein